MTFKSGKYNIWYQSLMEKAKIRNIPFKTEGTERHHIIPRCLGGEDSPENMVQLTIREHYLAHLLLTKITEGQEKYKMVWALTFMSGKPMNKPYLSSRQFEKARKLLSKSLKGRPKSPEHRRKISEATKGERNPMWGKPTYGFKGKKHTPEAKSKISEASKKRIVSDETKEKLSKIFKGRKFTEKHRENLSNAMRGRSRKPRSEKSKEKTRQSACKTWYRITGPDGQIYITNNLRQFCEEHGLSQGNLSRVVRKVPGYTQSKGYTGEIISKPT